MQYRPENALEMVQQLPGFQIDEGDGVRGLAGALGNILIDDVYPSAKADGPVALLTRIPAGRVERIELIRGPIRGINLYGRAVVANVVLAGDTPAAVRWEANLLRSDAGPDKPGMNVSVADRWRGFDYNVGIDAEGGANGENGIDRVFAADGELLEIRRENEVETGVKLGLFLNSSTWIDDLLLRINGKLGLVEGPETLFSARVPRAPGAERLDVVVASEAREPSFELGVHAERLVTPSLTARGTVQFTHKDLDLQTTQTSTTGSGLETLHRNAESRSATAEGIARTELEWSGITDHLLQLSFEAAFNSLDNSMIQFDDFGAGPLPVDIPGANSQVEEIRGDLSVNDTWNFGDLQVDYGLGAEISRISQTGDSELKRDFFFLKPRAALIYSPSRAQQYRLSVSRDVSQLEFTDFVSAAVFEDDDLALGNPNLRPETSWMLDVGYERRFGDTGVIAVELFHHWISDVQDLLPVTPDFESPGNIGEGRRRGIRLKGTLPLDGAGLAGARLDLNGRWQESSVTDPVTGLSRPLSAKGGFAGPPNIPLTGDNEYVVDLAYRQDFPDARVAWGWDIAEQAHRPRFKVNELETFDEGLEVNVFLETTRWLGIKVRLEGRNLLDYTESRDRLLYEGYRGLTGVSSRIVRERIAGRRVNLVLSGTF